MKIIIIGAGLGGLSAAIGLAKRGHNVKVLERKDRLWTVGGAINITSGAAHMMGLWGLHEPLANISDHTAVLHRRDLKSGDIHQTIQLAEGREAQARTCLRPDLIHMLFDEAVKLGILVNFSSTVVDLVENSTSASVNLEDGSTETADLIISTDGVRSRMRSKVLGSYVSDTSELDPIHSNRIYYVVNFDTANLPESVSSSKLLVNKSPTCINFWSGRDDKYAISLFNPIKQNLTIVYCVREPIDMKTLWDENGDIKDLRKKFEGACHPELQIALNSAERAERWQLSQMPDLPSWRSKEGRIILLGDAAHAMHPTAGHGFSSIAEEVEVLSIMLDRRGEDVAEATREWEEVSKARSDRVKGYANFLSRQYEGEPEAWAEAGKGMARMAELKKTDPQLEKVVGNQDAPYGSPEFHVWLARYEALREAQRYLETHQLNGVK